jgi:hypothetical protein
VVSPTDVLAVARGCVVLAADAAWLHAGEAPARLLTRQASAIARHAGEILVATSSQIIAFDLGGRERSRLRSEVEVTALAETGGWRVVGFRNGSLELLPARAGQRKPGFHFESPPASPVLRIVPGPTGTVAAGFASGEVGLWAVRNGTLLERFRLHGPVVHLHFAAGRLHAATELGDHRTLDLGVFYVPYCTLLRQLWQDVPVVWEDGLTRVRERPRSHRCAR